MPKFIDYHAKLPAMPPQAVQQMIADVKAGKADQFKVKGLNAYFTKDGKGYCLTDAPNVDAVCKSHQAKGIVLDKGDVHEIAQSLV